MIRKIIVAVIFVSIIGFSGCGEIEAGESSHSSMPDSGWEADEETGFTGMSTFTEAGEDSYCFVPLFWNNYLMYWECQKNVCVPLCSKPECTHQDASCNAYLFNMSPYTLQKVGVDYYVWAGSDPSTLYRVHGDGTGYDRVTVFSLGGFVMESVITGEEAYVHVSYGQDGKGDDIAGIYRISLTDSYEPKCIAMGNADTDWTEHILVNMDMDHQKLYFEVIKFRDGECASQVFQYDPASDELNEVLNVNHQALYLACGDLLAWSCPDDDKEQTTIWSMTEKQELCTIPKDGNPFQDDSFLYLTVREEDRLNVYAYDWEGREIALLSENELKGTSTSSIYPNWSSVCFEYDIRDEETGQQQLVYHLYPKRFFLEGDPAYYETRILTGR